MPLRKKLEALPGGNPGGVQGYSADLVILDEAGFASTELYNALSPSLAATDGEMIIAGRPNGKQGPLWDIWAGGDGWDKHRVTAESSSLISKAFLASERRNMDERSYAENYLAKFAEPSGSYFTHERVMAAITPDVEVLDLEGVDLCTSTT